MPLFVGVVLVLVLVLVAEVLVLVLVASVLVLVLVLELTVLETSLVLNSLLIPVVKISNRLCFFVSWFLCISIDIYVSVLILCS